MSRRHTNLARNRWAAIRIAVFKRDNYRCVLCGSPGRLECDHIRSLNLAPGQNPYRLGGLQTLCRGCHIAKTSRENRREPTEAELAWRELVKASISET